MVARLGPRIASGMLDMGLLTTFKRRVQDAVVGGLELFGFFGSLAGASISLFLGKLFASLLFVLLAVGVLNRFVRRRRGDVPEEQRAPVWVIVTCVVLSIIEAGLIVEATDLPVRFNQRGFEKSNWLFVAAVLLVFFYGQKYLLMRLLARRTTDAIQPPVASDARDTGA